MNDGRLKQRLVGAIVLVALGVIFIPILLSGGRDTEMPVFGSNVPEKTQDILNIKHLDIDVDELSNTEPAAVNVKRVFVAKNIPEPKLIKEKEKSIRTSIIETLKEVTTTKKEPVIKKTVWAVQVGSFAKKSNALRLKEKLRKKKMPAFIERIVNNNKAVYRVRVGPESSRKKAEVVKQKLIKELMLTGIVVQHP